MKDLEPARLESIRNSPGVIDVRHRVAPLAVLVIPGLFAVGAGTVLIGQEREQRTMDWLTTLPIPSRNLILIKIGVALAGLALMWALALATLAVTGIGKDDASSWLTFRGGRIAANNLAKSITFFRYKEFVKDPSMASLWSNVALPTNRPDKSGYYELFMPLETR